jgi:hypothetical protein
MTEVLLPDVARATAEASPNSPARLASIGAAILGGLITLNNPPLGLGVLGTLMASGIIDFLSEQFSPSEALAQMNNQYWYLVKRRIFCGLPNSTEQSVLTEEVRDHPDRLVFVEKLRLLA